MIINMANTTKDESGKVLQWRWKLLFSRGFNKWIGVKPKAGDTVYPCYACGDIYSSLQCLRDHINRRITVMKYNCKHCPGDALTFYNRCSLLLHARLHFNKDGGSIDLSSLDFFSLPSSLAGFLPTPSVPVIFGEEAIATRENEHIDSQFYIPVYSDEGKRVVNMMPSNAMFRLEKEPLVLRQVARNLPKCLCVTYAEEERRKALNATTENNVLVKEEPVEDEEPPSQQMTLPIITKVESLYVNEAASNRCPECDTLVLNLEEHFSHLNSSDRQSLICEICKYISPTRCSLKAHVRVHSHKKPHICPDCGLSFDTWDMLSTHISQVCFHLEKRVRYRCPGKKCGKIFATLQTFTTHFRTHMEDLLKCNTCKCAFRDVGLAAQHPCKLVKNYVCLVCRNVLLSNREDMHKHIAAHANKPDRRIYVYVCKNCRNCFRSTTTYIPHLSKCTTKRCKPNKNVRYVLKRFDSRDLKDVKAQIRPICVLCKERISGSNKNTHRKTCKFANPLVLLKALSPEQVVSLKREQVTRFSSSGSDTTPTSAKHQKKRSSESEDSPLKRRRRIRYKKPVKEDPTVELPVEFDGTYRCKLCAYNSKKRDRFHSHVKTHRDVNVAYQCMECGECFIVKPTLIKHLMHFHKIADGEKYLSENDCYDREAVKELEEAMRRPPGESDEPVKENQCRVCREEFGNALELSKHFRIHGMAFLFRNSK